jgi:type III secretion system FlhB-like substrate exporter
MQNKKVIGIGYDPESDTAPTVVLKGSGSDAEVALEQARRRLNVLIVRDPQLVEQLYRLPVDASVGRDLFTVMAALLAHVMRLDCDE